MKSKNKSIRFNIEQMDFAIKKLELDTPQKVFDKLLDNFWWQHHNLIEKESEDFMVEKEITIKPKEEDIPNWKKQYNEYLKSKNIKK